MEEEKQNNDEGSEDKKVVSLEEYEAQVAKLEELKETLEKTQSDLEHVKSQERNFHNLKTKLSAMTEEEKEKLNEREKALLAQQEELDNRLSEFETRQVESWKNKALKDLAVDDEEETKKVLGQYDRLIDKADTEEDVLKKMRTAYALANEGRIPTGSTGLAGAIPFGGSAKPSKPAGFAETEQGKKLGSLLGLKISEDKK